MNSRILGCLCFVTCASLGCYYYDDDSNVSSGFHEEITKEPEKPQPPVSPADENKKGSVSSDTEPGPCPVDRYVLLTDDGVEYIVEIEVFCEPIPVYNLGCPPPPHI